MADRLGITVRAFNYHVKKWAIIPESDGQWDAKKVEASFAESRAMNKNQGGESHVESSSLLHWKTKLEEAKTRKLERENDIEEGKLVWAHDVEAVTARVNQSVVADVLSACQAVAPRLEGLSVRAMAAKLEETMKDALRHIAEKKPEGA